MKIYEEVAKNEKYSFTHNDIEKYSFVLDCIDALMKSDMQTYKKQVERVENIPKILEKGKLKEDDWKELKEFGIEMNRYYFEKLYTAKSPLTFAC